MSTILLALWVILFGVMALFPSQVPNWIVPFTAIAVGLIVLVGAWRSPKT